MGIESAKKYVYNKPYYRHIILLYMFYLKLMKKDFVTVSEIAKFLVLIHSEPLNKNIQKEIQMILRSNKNLFGSVICHRFPITKKWTLLTKGILKSIYFWEHSDEYNLKPLKIEMVRDLFAKDVMHPILKPYEKNIILHYKPDFRDLY